MNEVLSSFDSLNEEFLPGFYSVNIFSDQFSIVNCKDIDAIKIHHNRLDKTYEDLLNNQDTILVITNASVKNNVATSVSHIQKGYNIVNKCVHYAININFTEVELFAIRYGID